MAAERLGWRVAVMGRQSHEPVLVLGSDGRPVACVYEEQHAATVAAAPEALDAMRELLDRIIGGARKVDLADSLKRAADVLDKVEGR